MDKLNTTLNEPQRIKKQHKKIQFQKGENMQVELITKDDFERFKKELLEEIRKYNPHPRKQSQKHREWLKSYEVREMIGISPGTLQTLRVNGTLRYTKIGGLMYYRYLDIRKLMDGET